MSGPSTDPMSSRNPRSSSSALPSGILGEIVAAKRRRIANGEIGSRAAASLPSDGRRFLAALVSGGPNVVAEIKHRSPSAGVLLPEPDAALPGLAHAYRRGGAAALSVVIEEDFFGGRPEWLPAAKAASGLPVLMKDFVVDEVQLDLALALGADAVLLIVAALDDPSLARLHAAARARGLAVLVEVHDEAEAARAATLSPELVGVNARSLATFAVDLDRLAAISDALPKGAVRVAESGIRTGADVARLAEAGFGAFLVGETLVRSADPARTLRALRGVGETEVKVCGVTRLEDVAACVAESVDWIGLNFSPLSKRRVATEVGARLREAARGAKGVVAVFAGNGGEEIADVVARVRPDAVQLTDAPDAGGAALGAARAAGALVWRAVRVGRDDLDAALSWRADLLLFDTAVDGLAGGSGRAFDWSELSRRSIGRPFALAGGLTAANVEEAIARVGPAIVDVASGVESAPGVKDRAAVAAFVVEARRGRRAVEAALPRRVEKETARDG